MLTPKEREVYDLLAANQARGLVFAASSRLSPSMRQTVPRLRGHGLIATDRFVVIGSPPVEAENVPAKPARRQAPRATAVWSRPERQDAFLAALERTGSVGQALIAVGLSPKSQIDAYGARAKDAAFRARWDAAAYAGFLGRPTGEQLADEIVQACRTAKINGIDVFRAAGYAAPHTVINDLRRTRRPTLERIAKLRSALAAALGIEAVPGIEAAPIAAAMDANSVDDATAVRPEKTVVAAMLMADVRRFCDDVGTTRAQFARVAGFRDPDKLNRAIRQADAGDDTVEAKLREAMARWTPDAVHELVPIVEGAFGTVSNDEVARRRAETEAAHEAREAAARDVARREREERDARRARMAQGSVFA